MSQFYQALVQNAQRFPSQEAIVEDETRWTYPQFLQQVDLAASAFKAKQVARGDRIGLMLYNQKEFLTCFFALRKIGAIVVPINIQMLRQDIAFVIQNAGLRHIVIDSALYPHLKPYPLSFIVVGDSEDKALSYETFLEQGQALGAVEAVEIPLTDTAFLLYTSGTTGYPKGVMLSERNVLANLEGLEQVAEFGAGDRMILALPLFHAFGIIIALIGLMTGASLSLIPKFQPKTIVEKLVSEKATVLPLVPTLFTVILDLITKQGGIEVPNLRFCISGGASLPSQLLKRIEAELKAPVLEGYGLTETSPVLTINDPCVGSIPGCVGKPLPNVEVRIVHEDGTPCATGDVGEIWVRGENVMKGYYNLPQDSEAAFAPDSWLKTGDLGHLDADGRLFISGGRKKDLIIKAGENISPLTIEEVLYHHPAIREAAVIGIPDPKLGEEIAACLSLKEGQSVTESEIIRFCREQLSPAYVPKAVFFFEELPKNPAGKIVKKLLREDLAKRASALP